jgi:DNA-binding transcriptional ArsR family regulator
MNEDAVSVAGLATLLADPSRVKLVLNLMDGSARTASELAFAANLSAPSASMHLAKLVRAHILTVKSEGRNKYYRIASSAMAHAIEAMSTAVHSTVSIEGRQPARRLQFANPWAFARTCYDHLAGRLGVDLADALQRRECLVISGGTYQLTSKGTIVLDEFGIDSAQVYARRAFATQCLDWTERRSHIGGALGAALLSAMMKKGWLAKSRIPRLLRLTASGESELSRKLGLVLQSKP